MYAIFIINFTHGFFIITRIIILDICM